MKTLLFSLIIVLAPAASMGAGLNCQEDASNSSDPYKKMYDSQVTRTKNDYQKMVEKGVSPKNRDKMIKSIMDDYVDLCKEKKAFDAVVSNFQATANGSGLTDGSGAANKIAEPAKTMSEANEKYVNALRGAYKRQTANFEAYVNGDRMEAREKKMLDDTWVKDSFRKAWGFAPNDRPNQSTKKTAQFPSLIREINEELENVKKRNGELSTLAQKVETLKKNSNSIGDENLKAGAKPKDEWGNLNNDTPGISDPNAEQNPAADPNADANALNDPNANKTPPYVDETGGKTPENLGPVKEDKGPSWVARNKGVLLLGAGTAAVVGGALWYKHEQDKKMDETLDWINDQVNSSTATTTVTSTSTTTTTSTVARTLTVTGFPSSAAVNYVIPKITATVTGSDGVEVTIACVSECTLTGTLTKTTVGGKAEFSDLYFTAPHEGVQLRVSATGLDSVASPGSFSVIEAAARE